MRRDKQRGQQTFIWIILMVYSRFSSVRFAFQHSLTTMFPRVPHLSVAVYVVRIIIATKEAPHMNGEALCSSLAFRLCISPSLPISFYRLLAFNSVLCWLPKTLKNAEYRRKKNDQHEKAHCRHIDGDHPCSCTRPR